MDKPKPKKEVAIYVVIENLSIIYFYASKDALEDIRDFGYCSNGPSGSYVIYVDKRYDFDEVLKYIENYG